MANQLYRLPSPPQRARTLSAWQRHGDQPLALTAPEIAGELYVSVNTVKIHVGNLYAKLGNHRRSEAVTRTRDLGLLTPSTRAPAQQGHHPAGRAAGFCPAGRGQLTGSAAAITLTR